MTKCFNFRIDFKAHTDAGTELYRNFRVAVEASSLQAASEDLHEIATEWVADAGSDLLDGNLESIEITKVRVA